MVLVSGFGVRPDLHDPGVGCRVWGWRVEGVGCQVQSVGCRMSGVECRV